MTSPGQSQAGLSTPTSTPIHLRNPNLPDKPRSFTAGSLPTEILINILPMLAHPEIARMLRVSREVHLVALPYLYTDLTIDLNRKINPVSFGGVAIGEQAVKSAGPSESQTPPLIPLPDRFSYTKHLTIVSHDQRTCAILPSPSMPNLISLRVRPAGREDHLDLCIDGRSIYERPMVPSSDDHTPCCPLVASLQPKRLILGDCTTSAIAPAKGLWSSPCAAIPPFPSSIREIIIVVGMMSAFEPLGQPASILDSLPRSVEKVTFVQSGADEGWEKIRKRDGDIHPAYAPAWVTWAVAKRCAALQCAIEIVQTRGVVTEGRIPEAEAAVQPLALSHDALIEAALFCEGRGMEDVSKRAEARVKAGKRAEAVRFVDEHGFRKREPWYAGVVAASLAAAIEKVDRRAGLVDSRR